MIKPKWNLIDLIILDNFLKRKGKNETTNNAVVKNRKYERPYHQEVVHKELASVSHGKW